MTKGLAIAVVGPSGAGKDTLMRGAMAAMPSLHLQQRVITRPVDPSEDFLSVSRPEFARMKAQGDFVLDWEAHGLCYAIPSAALACIDAGETVLLNLSRGAVSAAAAVFPRLLVLYVFARPDVLAARLSARGREDAADISRRIQRAHDGAQDLSLPVTHIDNSDSVEHALDQFLTAIRKACS